MRPGRFWWGEWLHRRLANYPIPPEFQGLEVFDGAVLGKNLRPVFRDRHELASSADIGKAIHDALTVSMFLVVLCSKDSAKSKWVNKEIEEFQAMGKGGRILALILDGEPNATSGEHPERECFPPALRYPSEPIAGDLRKEGDGKERGFLKILAGIAQLNFDELYKRHERQQARKRIIASFLAVALIFLFAEIAGYAWFQQKVAEEKTKEAIQARDLAATARDQAEELISFMTFDMWDNLNDVGRLDLMDDMIQAVERYHQKRAELMEIGGDILSDKELRRRFVNYDTLGKLMVSTGNLPEAEYHYRLSTNIAEDLVAFDAKNDQWQRDLYFRYVDMAKVLEMSEASNAQEWWRKAHEQLLDMKRHGILLPTYKQFIEWTR